jgi:hypothetical protein
LHLPDSDATTTRFEQLAALPQTGPLSVPKIDSSAAELKAAARQLVREAMMAQLLLECGDCGALMTAERMRSHQDQHAEATQSLLDRFARA